MVSGNELHDIALFQQRAASLPVQSDRGNECPERLSETSAGMWPLARG